MRAFLACLTLSIVCGCGSEGFKVSTVTQSVAYHDRVTPSSILLADPPNCAVLPALTPTTSGGLTPLVDTTCLFALREVAPHGRTFSSAESIDRMNEAGIAGTWQSLAKDYAATGVMDRERLSKIGKAIDRKYVIVPMLGYINSDAEQQVQPLGITIAVTAWVSVWTSIQVWDAERGSLLWASSASCTIATEVLAASGAPIHQALRSAFERMFTDLVENRQGSVFRETITSESMQTTVPAGAGAPVAPAAPATPAAPTPSTTPATR
ncbi:MAG: hypothetical protein RI990_702 [Planctomycetota bacterium]